MGIQATIIGALDDLTAAVDVFSKRLEYIDRNIDSLHDRVIGLENRADERLDNLTDQLRDIERTLEELPKDVANVLEEHSVLEDARELIETLDRKERQEMLQDARSGKHVVGFAF